MRLLLLALLMSACNGLGNPFASKGSGTNSEEPGTGTPGASTEPKDLIVDASGAVIGTLESNSADLTKDFNVRLEDGTRVVLNNSSPIIILAEGAPTSVAFTNYGCNAEQEFRGAIVQTSAKGAFPLTIGGESRLYKASYETQGTILSFLVRKVHLYPDMVCKDQPPNSEPITKEGYKLDPYEPPFAYPFNLPLSRVKPPTGE